MVSDMLKIRFDKIISCCNVSDMKRRSLERLAGAAGAALIVVYAGCSSVSNMRGNNQQGADKNLSKKVQHALENDPAYKFPNVSVSAYRGDVQLAGVVNTPAEREAALNDARATPGVLGVQDKMTMNTNAPVAPAQ